MQYNKDKDGNFTLLPQKNVDTGLGFERVLAIMNDLPTIYDTELFAPIIKKIEELTGAKYTDPNVRAFRIVADHLRASTFVLGDDRGVAPSNTDQGYILRRLIRRAYRYLTQMNAPAGAMTRIVQVVVDNYKDMYPELERNHDFVIKNINREEELFSRTLESGMKIATKELDYIQNGKLAAAKAFKLYETYGFPLEFTEELAAERGISVDTDGFHKLFAEHQEKSRAGAEQKFKGGLADDSVETTKLHTAAHLMNAALRQVLGDTVFQRGANINAERLRFDFSFDRKVTSEELAAVEKLVNEVIAAAVPVTCAEMSVADAKASGAMGVFDDRYGDLVKVYTIGEYSREICGGPHTTNTAELRGFKIKKEEGIAAGVRRIKAVIG